MRAPNRNPRISLRYKYYIYCGEKQKCDIDDCIQLIAKKKHCIVKLTEIDLCRGGDSHDIADDGIVATII